MPLTTNTRKNQPWYKTGKSNECEMFQKEQVEQVTTIPLQTTYTRVHLPTSTLHAIRYPNKLQDGFDYTENFDGVQSFGDITIYYNLKMVCGQGGAQTRTLREVYHFIRSQLSIANTTTLFVNILDGDESQRHMDKFEHLTSRTPHVFVGNLLDFRDWYSMKYRTLVSALLAKELFLPTVATKQRLGQFYTTNYEWITQGMCIPDTTTRVIEPFVGNGDLLKLVPDGMSVEQYDIDPQMEETVQRDTLQNPPDYTNAFVLTNPPYLARNKCTDKSIFNLYNTNDLYKCFIKSLKMTCQGGILIVPVNFFSSIRKADITLRQDFFSSYKITRLNVFETRVFEDTTYNVCCFQFESGTTTSIPTTLFPSQRQIELTFINGVIGAEIYNLPTSTKYTVTRWTRETECDPTNIMVHTIDMAKQETIGLVYCADKSSLFQDTSTNLSARTFATLVITPALTHAQQQELVSDVNSYIKEQRDKYLSLFLSNYRDGFRKRVSFDLMYRIVGYFLMKME